MRRGRLHHFELGVDVIFVLAENARLHSFALDHIRHENGLPIEPADSFTAKSDVVDFKLNNARHCERFLSYPERLFCHPEPRLSCRASTLSSRAKQFTCR